MTPGNFQLDFYDEEKNIYFIGNTINTPGNELSGSGALSSAKRVMKEVKRREGWMP